MDLLKKADFNAKITEAKNKIPSTTGLVTSFVLTAVENETPNVCSLLKKNKKNRLWFKYFRYWK